MDLIRFGRGIRALRLRRRWRQQDLAAAADLSSTLVARIERGQSDTVPPKKLARIANALGARVDVRLSWQGEGLDRLLDTDHARLVERVASWLRAAGWAVAVEVSFSIRGERGSIDVMAWHEGAGVVLVIEVKTVVPDIQAMLLALDRKERLAIEIARSRDWAPTRVGKILVVADTRTARRRVEALAVTFATEFPDRSAAIKRWIRSPERSNPPRGLLFLSNGHQVTGRQRAARR